MGDEDEDGLSGDNCPADGRIVTMIPVLMSGLVCVVLSGSCFFLAHRERRHSWEHEAEADCEEEKKSQGARIDEEGSSKTPAADADGAVSAKEEGGGGAIATTTDSTPAIGVDVGVNTLRFFSKVLLLVFAMAAETLCVSHAAFLLKAVPMDTSDETASNYCSASICAASSALIVVCSALATVGLVKVTKQIARDMFD